MDILKMLENFKKKELEELKKDRKRGLPIRLNPKSYYAKEISYQTVLLKSIIENQKAILNKEEIEEILEIVKNGKDRNDLKDVSKNSEKIPFDHVEKYAKEEVIIAVKDWIIKKIKNTSTLDGERVLSQMIEAFAELLKS